MYIKPGSSSKIEVMALRDSQIPNTRERTALQLLRPGGWRAIKQLVQASGPKTIEGMLRKGWIERSPSNLASCRITPDGYAALIAKIPDTKR